MGTNIFVTKILELAHDDPRLLERLEKCRRTVTVMFTDIKGSTEYFECFGDVAGLAMVHECNSLLRSVIEHHGGRVLKTIGDGVMARFDNCEESIRAAISIQRRLREKNATREKAAEVLVRIGLHHGTGIVKSDDVFGDVVNVASRVESVALPEQIIISDSLREQISPLQFDVVFFGRFRLKGKSKDCDLFQVRWNDTQFVPPTATHTMVIRPSTTRAKLQQLTRDGAVSAEYALGVEGVTVGGAKAERRFPQASNLREVRARFSLEDGQPTVEEISEAGHVFMKLVATYTLESGDTVAMGTHLFKFVCKPEMIAAANVLGKTLSNVSELLSEPVAEFVAVNPDGSKRPANYPLREEEVTFGRVNATFTFNCDPLMSRCHARAYHRGEDFFLEDMGSRNGTFVMVRGKAAVPFGASVFVDGQAFRIVQ
jgi:class 3 adenylate cyclase